MVKQLFYNKEKLYNHKSIFLDLYPIIFSCSFKVEDWILKLKVNSLYETRWTEWKLASKIGNKSICIQYLLSGNKCQERTHCTAYLLALRFCNIFCINDFLFKTWIVFLRHLLKLHASVLYLFTRLVLEFTATFHSAGELYAMSIPSVEY